VTELNKTEFSRQNLIKFSSIKFHANTLVVAKLFKEDKQTGGRADERTDRLDEIAAFATSRKHLKL
jgi:hypothetical protein